MARTWDACWTERGRGLEGFRGRGRDGAIAVGVVDGGVALAEAIMVACGDWDGLGW